jgi:hypothetical protein
MRGNVSKPPVASACEHARDAELHTDDVPQCMSNHLAATRPLPHYDQQLRVQRLLARG